MPLPLGFVPPCLPTKASQPPSGYDDGFTRHRAQGRRSRPALQPPW
jgi:hypothetical protein